MKPRGHRLADRRRNCCIHCWGVHDRLLKGQQRMFNILNNAMKLGEKLYFRKPRKLKKIPFPKSFASSLIQSLNTLSLLILNIYAGNRRFQIYKWVQEDKYKKFSEIRTSSWREGQALHLLYNKKKAKESPKNFIAELLPGIFGVPQRAPASFNLSMAYCFRVCYSWFWWFFISSKANALRFANMIRRDYFRGIPKPSRAKMLLVRPTSISKPRAYNTTDEHHRSPVLHQ